MMFKKHIKIIFTNVSHTCYTCDNKITRWKCAKSHTWLFTSSKKNFFIFIPCFIHKYNIDECIAE